MTCGGQELHGRFYKAECIWLNEQVKEVDKR